MIYVLKHAPTVVRPF